MTDAGADIQASLNRTAEQYDAVPYTAIPFSRLQPQRLAAVAALLGMKAPPVATARTLEIGCATGGHIIPLAARFPDARFIGLDVSAAQIEQGRARAARLGLGNIEFQARSLTELGPEDGLFDYIVCHGVYSWIPQFVRDELMRVVSERLSPEGIAVISFNVLPGWRMFQVVRDSMILHAGHVESHEQRTAYTRMLFEQMAKHGNADTTYGGIWRREAKRMSDLPDFYIAHELFEENNTPLSFRDFMKAASQHGLAYLGESRPLGNIPENSSASRAALLRGLSGGELLATEQYIDIVTGRTFRESLLIHEARATLADRSFDPVHLEGLHVLTTPGFKVKDTPGGGCTVVEEETEIDVNDLALATAIRRLVQRAPASSSLDDLAPAGLFDAEKRADLAAVLTDFICRGMLDASAEPVACQLTPGEKPRVWPLAASDAAARLDRTATLRHTVYDLSPFSQFVMPLLDGTRARGEIVEKLAEGALNGVTTMRDAAGPVTDPARIRELCGVVLDREIDNLAAAGLLVG